MADVPYLTEVGYTFPTFEIMITPEEQRRLHGHCDIPESLYGGLADPTFIARDPITLSAQTILANHPERAPVHTVHRIEQRRPIRLGETLEMSGRVTAIDDHPKGWTMTSLWEYRDIADDVVFVTTPDVLMIDPVRPTAPGSAKQTSKLDGFDLLLKKECTPKTTVGYLEGSTNKIHLDPATAQSFGFRAPIIAGNQTVNFLMAAVCRDGLPGTLSIETRFLRPVFWDDAIDIEGRREADGTYAYFRAANQDDKTVAELRVIEIGN
ncbi:MAG: MaoC family dehydratase [Pseudomonadota bacterium]|nr:MaoC family dehydratase [Pseudomonadota bacterium]